MNEFYGSGPLSELIETGLAFNESVISVVSYFHIACGCLFIFCNNTTDGVHEDGGEGGTLWLAHHVWQLSMLASSH